MWPKLLTQYLPQLIEILPHVSRVVPLADKYLTARSASDAKTEAKLDTLSETMRGDLGKVARAHIDLATRLDEFAGHVAETATETKRTRMAIETEQARIAVLETSLKSLGTWIKTAVALLAFLLLLVLFLLLRIH